MMNAKDFMDEFMRKLNNDEFIKDNQPNNGPSPRLSECFIR